MTLPGQPAAKLCGTGSGRWRRHARGKPGSGARATPPASARSSRRPRCWSTSRKPGRCTSRRSRDRGRHLRCGGCGRLRGAGGLAVPAEAAVACPEDRVGEASGPAVPVGDAGAREGLAPGLPSLPCFLPPPVLASAGKRQRSTAARAVPGVVADPARAGLVTPGRAHRRPPVAGTRRTGRQPAPRQQAASCRPPSGTHAPLPVPRFRSGAGTRCAGG